jgi:glycosyltransferase involved in cell wall biosynthesis
LVVDDNGNVERQACKMNALEDISPLILTFNEAPNIRRTLEKLAWAQNILVLDSFSTDETIEIVRSFPQTRVVQRQFDTHTHQWNFGIGQTVTPWVLALDADYTLPTTFAGELETLQPSGNLNACFARFRYCILGHPLRSTLYPSRPVLFRKDRCHYVQDGHTQRLQIEGQTTLLKSVIDHDDRKPLSHWLWAQDRYTKLEAVKLAGTPVSELTLPDRLRHKIIVAPFLVFFNTLLVKGLILDGWPGWFYVFQRMFVELMLSLRLMEAKLELQNRDS